jgi:polygalacturonase
MRKHTHCPAKAAASAGLLALITFSFLAPNAHAENITFPSDSGVARVTDFGATPNDGTDDTLAFQNAIKDVLGSVQKRILYVPNGTYNISNRLEWRNSSGAWATGLTLQGQSRNGTVLRLNDNVFTDANNAKRAQSRWKRNWSGVFQLDSQSHR